MPERLDYDADKQQATARVPFMVDTDAQFANGILAGQRNWTGGSYIGTNGFGVKLRVTIHHSDSLLVESRQSFSEARADEEPAFPLPLAEAKQALHSLVVRFIGSPHSPFCLEKRGQVSAELNRPRTIGTTVAW